MVLPSNDLMKSRIFVQPGKKLVKLKRITTTITILTFEF